MRSFHDNRGLLPTRWFWMGRTERWEWAVTFRLPWRRKMYDLSRDAMVIGYPRVGLRIRWGCSIDRAKIVQPCLGVSDPFADSHGEAG
jgi:hypothetical protein